MEKTVEKTIITVVGKDTVGIIAKVCMSINGDRVVWKVYGEWTCFCFYVAFYWGNIEI